MFQFVEKRALRICAEFISRKTLGAGFEISMTASI
jgi:hypothetical protein